MRLREKSEIREDYDREAPVYDLSRFASPGGRYLYETEMGVVRRNLREGSVLDLGVGTGRCAAFLAGEFPIVGIDISAQMLSQARREKRAEYLMMDIENLGFREASFQNAVCVHVFQYLTSPIAALKETSRILEKGGRCIVVFETPNVWVRALTLLRIIELRQNLYTHREVRGMLEKTHLRLFYFVHLFNFPIGLYRRVGKNLLKLFEWVDRHFHFVGSLCLVAAEKK